MAKTTIKVEKGSIQPIIMDNMAGIFIALTLDTRKHSIDGGKPIPVCVRVTFNLRTWYYRTGQSYTVAEYRNICNAGKTGMWFEIRAVLREYYDSIVKHIRDIQKEGDFSIEQLKERASKRSESGRALLYEFWEEFGRSKDKSKTISQYISALNSFKAFKGVDSQMTVRDVTADIIAGWDEAMKEKNNSPSSRSMYLRALRAVLRHAKDMKIILRVPEISIPKSDRRTDNFLAVADILKLRAFKAPSTWSADEVAAAQLAIDYWVLLYLCNGCNTIDLATMRWNDSYFFDAELSFQRSKMSRSNHSATTIKIPIIIELQELLDKYGSSPKRNELVFPAIVGNAKTEAQIASRVHDFNGNMRKQLAKVCEVLGIRPVTAQYARNSFITCLTFHGVSDSYIDRAVGHADNLLRGYQGEFSVKKRLKFNQLLLVDPEADNDSDELVERLKGLSPDDLAKLLKQL